MVILPTLKLISDNFNIGGIPEFASVEWLFH